jgi:rubrerythrin
MISRRQLLYFSALLSFFSPLAYLESHLATADIKSYDQYSLTIEILKEAYVAEMIASKHYDGYCQKALSENYPNIAYLFAAFSISEKIHADNYHELVVSLGSTLEEKEMIVSINDTKSNLRLAAIKELEKINEFYPAILKRLSSESNDQAVVNCMYSWKSHQQHEKMIRDIKRYSGIFFNPLANKIERMKPNFYVCEICGSIVDEKPAIPCEICYYPLSHYNKLKRPIY